MIVLPHVYNLRKYTKQGFKTVGMVLLLYNGWNKVKLVWWLSKLLAEYLF